MGPRLQSAICDKPIAGISQLLEDLRRLNESSENTGDIVFLLGDEDVLDKVYAHKIIMQARCKSFQTTKRGEICKIPGCTVSMPTATTHNMISIRLPHINADIFRQFIVYVYTAKIMLQDSRVFEMMSIAQDLGVEELKNACEEYVISTLSVDNACLFLSSCMEVPTTKLSNSVFMEKCISYIGENAAECVKTKSFLNLNREALIKIISSDEFAMDEADVFRSVLKWAKHQAGVTQPLPHWTEEERQRVCQQLTPIMGYLRLLLIDSKVFAEEVEPTGAVPMSLILERYRYAALHANKSPSGVSPQFLEDKRLQPRLMNNFFPGTSILKNDKTQFQLLLNDWFGVAKQNWQLIYRASAHSFSASMFHQMCDGIAPLYIIAIGADKIISGGFTDVAFSKTGRKGGYIYSDRAYLFTLNHTTLPSPTKFEVTKKLYSICYHSGCGPIFGAGADLLIADKCNTLPDSYSNLGHSYKDNGVKNLFGGEYNFIIKDYEIFTVANT